MRQIKYDYDAFISHAVEDKIPIANELCAKLEKAGLRIWYSGKELGVGDSIEKTIEKGLNRSRYGIVIFSPTYLAKNWTIREFYTLLAKEIEEHKVILPVLYNISLDELKNKDLLMADRFAVNSDRGIDFVVERLVREIRKPKVSQPKVAWFSRIWLILILSLLANIALLVKGFVLPQAGVSTHQSFFNGELSAQNMQAGLLGEMQNFLERANTCSCSAEDDQRNPTIHNAVMAGSPRQMREGDSHFENLQKKSRSANDGGKKLTMAVVIQIETLTQRQPPQQQPGLEHEVNDMLETLGMQDDDENPFIAISNRNHDVKSDLSRCVHSQNHIE